jgi:hypothetical protein
MSLRLRLIGLVCIAPVASLVLGGLMAWVNASRSVRIETHSALLAGPANDRESDRSAAECSRPVTQSR